MGVAHVEFAGVVVNGMVGAQRVHHGNQQVGLVEGKVIVAAIPDDDVGLLLGLAQDGLVVNAGVNDAARDHMRFVFLALLNRHIMQFHVVHRSKALHGLLGKVAIGHGMAHGHHAFAHGTHDTAAGLALARARARGANGNYGLGGLDHSVLGAKQHKIGAHGHGTHARAHDMLVGHIAVGKDSQVGARLAQHALEVGLGFNGNAFRVERAGERGGVAPPINIGDLCGRKGHHLIISVVAKEDIEIVKVAPGGAHNHNLAGLLLRHCSLLWEW